MKILLDPSYLYIGILSFISIAVFYFVYYKSINNKQIVFLFYIRVILLVICLLLFLNPKIEIKKEKIQNLPWHIYIDKSLSLKYYKQPSNRTYVKSISNFVNRLKQKKLNYKVFSFGSKVDSVSNILKLNTDASSTNIGEVFDNLNSKYDKNIAGAIIFTDGQINQGPLLSKFFNYKKTPVHIIGIGDTIPMLDISIQSIDLPSASVKGEEVDILVEVMSTGNVNERVSVTLFDDSNKLIGSKIIKAQGNESKEKIRFQVKPNKIGKNSYLVKCSALSDEINIQNNQQQAIMHVMKDQYNIALITGSPNYNTRLLKEFLGKTKNNNLDHYIFRKNQFEPGLNEFWKKKYELIIFDNNPIKENFDQWNSLFRVFAKKLISHNSSFLIIPSHELHNPAIANYLKILDIKVIEFESNDINDNNWIFTEKWGKKFSMDNQNSSLIISNSYPLQSPVFKKLKTMNSQEIKFAEYIEDNIPLLILGEKQSIRYGLWNSDNIHALKFKLLGKHNSSLVDNLLNNIFSWLMKKSGMQEYIFRSDKNIYQQGEKVNLSGKSINFNNKIYQGIVELYYENDLIGSKSLFYDMDKNEYRSSFWAPKPGIIDYIIRLNKDSEELQVSKGSFDVQESHIELNKIFLNEKKLRLISNSSGGKFRFWKDRDLILDEIINRNKKEDYIFRYNIRYNYLVILFIISLLILEWFLRRRAGLM